MNERYSYGIEDIRSMLPHRSPFLFVDKVTRLIPDKKITAEYRINATEPHFKGHFPQKPIMPGVLVTDALAQTCGLLWGFSKKLKKKEPDKKSDESPEIFFLASVNFKFTSPAFPDELLRMQATSDKSFGNLFTYTAEASVKRRLIAKGTLTLAMVEGDL